jgi:protein-tyrosine phosphatase
MKNILVVCTGNICRSPTGEYLLKKELGPDFHVMSAGLGALVDNPADKIAQKIALQHDIDMSAHRARQINLDILKWADLILVMENGHKRELLHRYPWLDGKVFRYGESHQVDIPDPYKRPENAYVLAWNFISKLTPYWVEKIRQSEAK